MTGAGDLSGLPEERILARMARHLHARTEHPVGSQLWTEAVTGYADCKHELDRRLLEHISEAVRKLNADRGMPDADL